MVSAAPQRAFPWYDPRQSRGRLTLGLVMGLVAWSILPRLGWGIRAIAGWDAASTTVLGLAYLTVKGADSSETRRRAAAEDPGRTAVYFLVLLACAVSLVAATLFVRQARRASPRLDDFVVALCLVAVASSWLLTHAAYMFRYARLFYRDDDDGVGGLEFPGKKAPNDLDFAYFSFTIGMCYQVSDVTVCTEQMRRTVLVHSVVSFAYNTTVLGLVLNLVFGRFG